MFVWCLHCEYSRLQGWLKAILTPSFISVQGWQIWEETYVMDKDCDNMGKFKILRVFHQWCQVSSNEGFWNK